MAGSSPLNLAHDASNEHFELKYFDPPEGLEKYILNLFELRHFEGPVHDRHIGALGHLFLTIRGGASGQFGDRIDVVDAKPALFNAFEVAVPYTHYGPLWCLGASLSPLGWAALAQVSVKEYGNRYMHASEVLGPDIENLSDSIVPRRLSDETSTEDACLEVAEWIRPRLKPVSASHERVIDKVLAWLGSSLDPPVEELVDDEQYSRRQMERLVQQYFGFAPKGLARKFRAVRAANILAQPDLTDEGEAELAEAFFDQPHMIREIRRFCGYTPSRLGGTGGSMFERLTHLQSLERMPSYRAIGKPDKT
ncbi:MAG: helix-turn-helix domain-containing protein [Pseudomonadota bacterium]